MTTRPNWLKYSAVKIISPIHDKKSDDACEQNHTHTHTNIQQPHMEHWIDMRKEITSSIDIQCLKPSPAATK